MKSVSVSFAFLIIAASCLVSSFAFAPKANMAKTFVNRAPSTTSLNIFDDKPERAALTRESEPEDFFQTNTDKMSDGEKFPIALMGLAGVSLPFVLGLIALYAAK